MSTPRFVIWTAQWNEAVGGTVALHTLCERLNRMGVPTALWPDYKPVRRGWADPRYWLRAAAYRLRGARRFDRGPFDNPLARQRDLRDAVVLYPEIVAGNSLGADRVARWFLHRPGHHTGTVDYGPGEIYFFYNPAFHDETLGRDAHMLRVTYMNPVYRQTNFGPREGNCFIVRKGQGRPLDAHPAGAVQVDALSHEEKARVFNRCERFYSYDPYTLYSLYASLCGCIAIVVPQEGIDVGQWSPGGRPPSIAYGEEDIGYAERTRPQLLAQVREDLEAEDRMIRSFVDECDRHFQKNARPGPAH